LTFPSRVPSAFGAPYQGPWVLPPARPWGESLPSDHPAVDAPGPWRLPGSTTTTWPALWWCRPSRRGRRHPGVTVVPGPRRSKTNGPAPSPWRPEPGQPPPASPGPASNCTQPEGPKGKPRNRSPVPPLNYVPCANFFKIQSRKNRNTPQRCTQAQKSYKQNMAGWRGLHGAI
jgi:hypothetical protein